MPRPTRILALLVPAALLAASPGIAGETGGTTPGVAPPEGADAAPNPCIGKGSEALLCPNLRMGDPVDIYAQIGRRRTLLRSTNRIQNVGRGPIEIRGRRKRPLRAFRMAATQAIKRRGGGRLLRRTEGELFFKPIPGQYRYWKFVDAAILEIWTLDERGRPERRVRKSPKQVYCFRDLVRMARPPRRSPRRRIYPACNQDPGKRRVTLGTSVGWVDRYPASYYQNYVDVTGLRGRFAYVHIADPENHLAESNEGDNMSYVTVTLPPRGEGYLPGY